VIVEWLWYWAVFWVGVLLATLAVGLVRHLCWLWGEIVWSLAVLTTGVAVSTVIVALRLWFLQFGAVGKIRKRGTK